MRRTKSSGGFFLCLLMNMILNFGWSIPAWILLILHFYLDWSIWLFIAALVIWFIVMLAFTGIISWSAKCSVPDPPRKNKNPYSAKTSEVFRQPDDGNTDQNVSN